ncbi:MAG: ParB N-terminal domain-containing protein [Deltaproteobacteria bacterium]|nr:ParB N-terminal domain-containing protein [Deltaproteobacteria bacterium]
MNTASPTGNGNGNTTGNANGNTNGKGNDTGHPLTAQDSRTPDTLATLRCPTDATQALAWIPEEQLQLSPYYQRMPTPDAGKLRELAVSIARDGLLQPLLATPCADGMHYEVLAGRRRLLAASGTGVALPVLVRHLVSHQKNQAFLAAQVCAVVPEPLDALTAAYDTTWTTIPAACDDDRTADSEDAARVKAVLAHVRQLSPFLQRFVVRDLAGTDATLWEGLLAEARQHVQSSDTSTRQRLEEELAAARQATREAQRQEQRYLQAVEQLGCEVTDVRIQYQRSEEHRSALEQQRHTLANENGQLRRQVATLRERLAAVGPVDHLADMPHVAAIAQAALDVVDAAGSAVVRHAIRLLDPRTARAAASALSRALLLVEERIQACRHQLTADGQTASVPAQEQEAQEDVG